MKIKRITIQRTTPNDFFKFKFLNFESGDGFNRLLIALARVIEKIFGLLYILISADVNI